MKKRVVLTFLAILLLALGLTFFSPWKDNTFTGRAIFGVQSSSELFIGNEMNFDFYPSSSKEEDESIHVKGIITEVGGKNRNLNITSYALDYGGRIVGEYSGIVFISANDYTQFAFRIPRPYGYEIREVVSYLSDGSSMVRSSYLIKNSLFTGNVIAVDNNEVYGSLLATIFIILILVVFMTLYKTHHRNRKNKEIHSNLSFGKTRKFIDLDID